MIDVQIIGREAVEAKLTEYPGKVYASVLAAMQKLGLELHGLVLTNLSGKVLKRRTGALAQAQTARTTGDGRSITTTVGFNASTVPYGKWQEEGVPHDWLIVAKNAKALRFEWKGQTMFRKSVLHPPLPERSFLRSALAEIAPDVKPTLAAAVAAAGAG